MYEGAIYAELEGARSEAVALADLLERLPAGQMEKANAGWAFQPCLAYRPGH